MLRKSVAVFHRALGLAQCLLDQNIAQARNFGGGFRQRSNFENVAKHDAYVLAPLETRQQKRVVAVKRPRAEARKPFGEFLMTEALIEFFLAQEGWEQVGVLNQSLAQVTALAEHGDGIVGKKN